MLAQKGCVVFLSDTLECNTEKIFIGFQYSLRRAEALCMSHPFKFLDNLHQSVVGTDGVGIAAAVIHDIVNLNMTAKAHNLDTDGVLESKHYANRYNHHSQSDSHTNGSYMNSWATNFSFVALIAINSLGYV